MPGGAAPQPYAELVELTETMCGLVTTGHIDELAALQQRASALWETAPAAPPMTAEPLLRRLQVVTTQLEQGLQQARSEASRELASVERGRSASRAYGGAPASTQRRVDASA